MSNLKNMINELCPNGVTYKKLDSYLEYIQPTKYIVDSTQYDDSYDTPVLTAGQTFILGYTNEKENIYKADKNNPVIIFDDFTTSKHWVDFNFKVKSSAMKILKIKNNVDINFKYLFYCMQNIQYIPKEHARQWIQTYSKFRIPVPPLEIQDEIVYILDKFTLLSAELEAELEARQKQYEYYRNKLLSFDEIDETVGAVHTHTHTHTHGYSLIKIKLSELFETKNGYTPAKANSKYWNGETSINWFRMEDIRENGRILVNSIQKVTKEAVKGKLFPANSIIISTSATIGEHALITIPSLANQRFTYLMLKPEYEKLVDIKYIFYYCYKLGDFCRENLNQGNFASVDMAKFNNFLFFIPSLKKQKKVVNILDEFDSLCNDISVGLPAEIKARKEQYEYYRNKLLTFKELSNN